MKLKRIISSMIVSLSVLVFTLPVFAENKNTKNSMTRVHIQANVPQSWIDKKEDITITLNPENGIKQNAILQARSNFSITIAVNSGECEVAISDNTKDYNITGLKNEVDFEGEDYDLTFTLSKKNIGSDSATDTDSSNSESKALADTNITNADDKTGVQIAKEFIQLMNKMPDDIRTYFSTTKYKKLFCEKTGEFNNEETWNTLSDEEKFLYWANRRLDQNFRFEINLPSEFKRIQSFKKEKSMSDEVINMLKGIIDMGIKKEINESIEQTKYSEEFQKICRKCVYWKWLRYYDTGDYDTDELPSLFEVYMSHDRLVFSENQNSKTSSDSSLRSSLDEDNGISIDSFEDYNSSDNSNLISDEDSDNNEKYESEKGNDNRWINLLGKNIVSIIIAVILIVISLIIYIRKRKER